MTKTALVTGASGGIGSDLAREHAKNGGNLVLVARNIQKLQLLKTELETTHSVKVEIIEKDLSLPNAAQSIFDETQKMGLSIDFLINNAGVGEFGLFAEYDYSFDHEMIELNITALTQLCKLYLPSMIAKKSGKILNVASTAAFQPGPTMAVYFATKAYVLHFSEALGNEVQNHGVTVTALCPGPTKSGFASAANMEDSKLMKDKKLPSSAEVAKYGYAQFLKGKPVAIHGMKNYIFANSVRFAPRGFVVKFARWMTGK